MASARKFLEKKIGPVTVGMMFRAYRTSNDMSAADLAGILSVTRGFISNIENGRKHLSLDKTLEFASKLKESRDLYAMVWFEEEARKSGISFEKIAKMKVA